MGNTGNMKSIAEIQAIIEDKYTYIPLLQRNYKWSKECAAELAEDLWEALRKKRNCYQLNVITIYSDEKNDTLQILDGQQRMITLKLLLSILDSSTQHLNYDFERDYMIDERSGRRYFINHILPEVFDIRNKDALSVDTLRLWENYNAMIVPMSFKTIYTFYNECLEEENKNSDDLKSIFRKDFNDKVINAGLRIYFGENANFICERLSFNDDEIEKIFSYCCEFQKKFLNVEQEDISNDEIRVSDISEKFQEFWLDKLYAFYKNGDYFSVIEKYDDAEGLVSFILNQVEMLYHETTSEPIDEFLNINENKTRFVISDYIRANMISDNPIDGEALSSEEKEKNQRNREEVLNLFAAISEYLYDDDYEVMWKLIKVRYDDFEKHPDINRLKIIFCDKYIGTSTKGYNFSEEIERLRYFKSILDALKEELGLGNQPQSTWNTYNAVYMLLECKQRYRFFNLFTKCDIDQNIALKDVTAREKFCFFEAAYNKAKNSDDLWDVSYFLESQLYDGECTVKKNRNLPRKTDNEWCFINRGEEEDSLYTCIKQLIKKIKSMGE